MVKVPEGARKAFHFQRTDDETGISGEGRVAEGFEFTDGVVVVRWLTHTPSTNIYPNLKQAVKIHGHKGKTKLVIDWMEDPEGVKEEIGEIIVERKTKEGDEDLS
jgi:hypothetical protein